MKSVAIRNIVRTEASVVEAMQGQAVATVHEANGKEGLLDRYIRPIYPTAKVCGTAVTVLLQPGDNWMLHVAVELCQPGDVLVAACTAESHHGFFGDLLAESCRAHGVRGLIIDGGVRDTETLEAMDFPVWSRSIWSQGTVKETPGAVNVPVVCAGMLVNPGDLVVADRDGVVVVRREKASSVMENALARESKEEAKRKRFAAGELGLDMYSMRERLAEKGLVYFDTIEDYESFTPK